MSTHNDNPLEYFMPGRVRGNDFETKLANFIDTIRKVISDSAEDKSQYRIDYAAVHVAWLENILNVELDERAFLENAIDGAHKLLDEDFMLEHPGEYDALGRLLAEAIDIISVD